MHDIAVRSAEHCCIHIPGRACVERSLTCARPRPPLKRNPWSPGAATTPWDASGAERRTDLGGSSGAWSTTAFPQNKLIFFLFSVSPLSLLLLLPLLVLNPGWV